MPRSAVGTARAGKGSGRSPDVGSDAALGQTPIGGGECRVGSGSVIFLGPSSLVDRVMQERGSQC